MVKKTGKPKTKVHFVEIVADDWLRRYEQAATICGRLFAPNITRVRLFRTATGAIGVDLRYKGRISRALKTEACGVITRAMKRQERRYKKRAAARAAELKEAIDLARRVIDSARDVLDLDRCTHGTSKSACALCKEA